MNFTILAGGTGCCAARPTPPTASPVHLATLTHIYMSYTNWSMHSWLLGHCDGTHHTDPWLDRRLTEFTVGC